MKYGTRNVLSVHVILLWCEDNLPEDAYEYEHVEGTNLHLIEFKNPQDELAFKMKFEIKQT